MLRELCDMTGKKSPATLFKYVCALEEKGYVKTTPGKRRSIRLSAVPPNLSFVVSCKDCRFRQKTFNGLAVWNLCHKLNRKTDDDYIVRQGDKITQLVIMQYLSPAIEVVSELDATDRGDNGFGSSGR